MKKTIIALAVAGFSFNAAAVDLKDNSEVATFASEIVPAQTVLGKAGNNALTTPVKSLNVKVPVGTEVSAASVASGGTAGAEKVFVRFDLDNARFVDGFTAADLLITGAPAVAAGGTGGTNGSVAVNSTIVAGGGSTDSYVVFQIDVAGAVSATSTAPAAQTLPADAVLELEIDRVVLSSRGDAGVTYRIYSGGEETIAKNATTDGIAAAKKAGTLLTFASALTFGADQATQEISLAEGGLKFLTGGNETLSGNIGKLIVTTKKRNANNLDIDAALAVDGTPLTIAKLFDNTKSSIVVEGDFSGVADKSKTSLFAAATSLDVAAGKATFGGLADTGTAGQQFSLTVDGVSQLVESGYKATLNLVPQTAAVGVYTLPISQEIELGNTEFQGDNTDLRLVLSDKSSFTQFVRVTNEGSVDATDVVFEVYDSAGNTAFVEQADIPARGASQPVAVKTIFAAAAEKNADLGNESLLRIKVRANAQSGSLQAQSYTLSKDVNSVQNLY